MSRFQILENECGQEHQYQTNEALMNRDDSVYHESLVLYDTYKLYIINLISVTLYSQLNCKEVNNYY